MRHLQRGIALWVLAVLVFSLAAPAALAVERYVYDDAGLFSSEAAALLENEAALASAEMGLDFIIATTADAQGKTAMQYADDFYDAGGFGQGEEKSGVLFLIDMENRELYLSTAGEAIRIMTDARIEALLDSVYAYAGREDFSGAASVFLAEARRYAEQGVPKGQYNYDAETGERDPAPKRLTVSPLRILLAAVVSLGAGVGACFVVRGRYQMSTPQYKYPVGEKSALALTQRQDTLINTSVITRRIPKPPPPGSGSSGSSVSSRRSTVHRSSGGVRHGGGGRKF